MTIYIPNFNTRQSNHNNNNNNLTITTNDNHTIITTTITTQRTKTNSTPKKINTKTCVPKSEPVPPKRDSKNHSPPNKPSRTPHDVPWPDNRPPLHPIPCWTCRALVKNSKTVKEELSNTRFPSLSDILQTTALMTLIFAVSATLILKGDSTIRDLYTQWGFIPRPDEVYDFSDLELPDGFLEQKSLEGNVLDVVMGEE
eukprot:scaffold12644_cov43-Cyclotella_meneghiniana.AAC.3